MADTQRYNFEQGKLADWVKVFSRTSSVPLDRSQLFDSYADALAYAQGDGSDHRGIGKTAWVGQPISVVENNVAKFYIISEKSTIVNGETVVERVLESVGSGVVVLENFTIQSGNIVEATADKVGSLVYITAGSAAYPKGLYIITGANKIAAFATPDNLKIVKKETANSGASATYELQLNGVKQGVAIDIPKDLVVSSGSIVTFTDNDKPFPSGVTTVGTYIKLTLANSGGDLYINVNSLVDIYTAGDDYIKVENYKISLKWDDVVAALIIDSNFTKFISDTLASFKTTLMSELNDTFATKQQALKLHKCEVFGKPVKKYLPLFSNGDIDNTYTGDSVKIPIVYSFNEFSVTKAEFYVDTTKIHTQTSMEEILELPISALEPFKANNIVVKIDLTLTDKSNTVVGTIVTSIFVELYFSPIVYSFETDETSDNLNSLLALGFIERRESDVKKVSLYSGVNNIQFNEGRILGIIIPKTYGQNTNIIVKSNGFIVPTEFWKEVQDEETLYRAFRFTTISGMVELSNVEIEVYNF